MKDKVLRFLIDNTLPILILILISIYMITRWGFSKGTVEYRIESMDQIDILTEKIDQLDKDIQELEIKIDELKKGE